MMAQLEDRIVAWLAENPNQPCGAIWSAMQTGADRVLTALENLRRSGRILNWAGKYVACRQSPACESIEAP